MRNAVILSWHRWNDGVGPQTFPLIVQDCDSSTSCGDIGGTCIDLVPFDGEYSCRVGEVDFAVTWADFPTSWPDTVQGRTYEIIAPPATVKGASANSSLRYQATGLPCGMQINSTTGTVSGVAGVSGRYTDIAIFAEVFVGVQLLTSAAGTNMFALAGTVRMAVILFWQLLHCGLSLTTSILIANLAPSGSGEKINSRNSSCCLWGVAGRRGDGEGK